MFKLNPCGISTKVAIMALTGNAIETIKHLPGHAVSGIASIKANKAASKTQKAMKDKMAIITELNTVENTIQDMISRGVTGDELNTAISYAAILRDKL